MKPTIVAVLVGVMTLTGCMDTVSHGLDAGTDAAKAQDELQAQAYLGWTCERLILQKQALEPSVTGTRIILSGGAAPWMRGQYDGIVEAMRRKGCVS